MRSQQVKKAIKKAMGKLVAFSLKEHEKLEVAFHGRFRGDIWVTGLNVNCPAEITIINAPSNDDDINRFNSDVEKTIALARQEPKGVNHG